MLGGALPTVAQQMQRVDNKLTRDTLNRYLAAGLNIPVEDFTSERRQIFTSDDGSSTSARPA